MRSPGPAIYGLETAQDLGMSLVKASGETEQTVPQETPLITDEGFSVGYQNGFQLTVRFLLSRGLSYELALETAQAAWTKGWEKRAQLRQPALLLTWMNTIALNLYRSSLRRESQSETLPPPAASVSLDVSAIDVERILTQCKPSDGKIIRNHYIDGYQARELAQLHGCTETAVRIRLYRARRKLQKQVLKTKSSRLLSIGRLRVLD